jgi:hypothetical protein
MSDALSKYKSREQGKKSALTRYENQSDESTLSALARYLGLDTYWDRQGRYANEGLALADQGAGELRNANPMGAVNMTLGQLGYWTSPINALVPSAEEINATDMSPEARRFLTAATASMMAIGPGGKAPKGLGRGMASLADDATNAERAALAGRMDAEAAQARPVSRANLTETAPLIDRYKSSLGRPEVTNSLVPELKAMSAQELRDFAKSVGHSGSGPRDVIIGSLVSRSIEAARDADIAERIRRGQ